MNINGRAIGISLLAVGLAFASADAQQGQRRGPPDGMGRGTRGIRVEQSVATMLSKRDELGLTDEQVADLEALRAEIQAASAPIRDEQRAFAEQVRAGDVSPNEADTRRRELAERTAAAMEPFPDRVHSLLTEAQQTQMQGLMRSTMGRGQGRGGDGQGQGMRRGGASTMESGAHKGSRQGRAARADRRSGSMGNAYSDGYRAGLRQGREMRHQGRRGRPTPPDSTGVGGPS